jgi:16S rRNA (cytidine1402-2'-O)-methyltransferase
MLYLIPTPIAEDALHTIPPYVQEIARSLDIFIVEKAKTARHFIKSLQPPRPIGEMIFVELDSRGNGAGVEAETIFREAATAGKDVGLLSEAGCPGVADPGAAIVAQAHRMGVRVVPLAGPSALLLALMASGMSGQRFVFHGYLSPKRPELARDLRRLEQAARQFDQTQIFIETPYRSHLVLEVALEALQPDTLLGIAQDITGAREIVRVAPVNDWKKSKNGAAEKLPGVFLLYREKK